MESRPGRVGAVLGELSADDPTRVGPYRIEAKIGEGGMGAVYLGRGQDERPVAVKVVRPELAGDRAFLARFNDECRNAERVASFCTAQVLDHGQDLGLAYMVTEYIEGPSLLQHIRENGTLSPGLLHGVAVGVAAALVAIHSAGLVHRDLKPSNVLLSISGPRVIDFGIARALDMATSHTATGAVVGTPGYIAPEQILTQQVTPAIDVFAWGCLVAYAANGRNPFGQGSLQVMVGRALHAEPELGDLPEPLAGLVRAALRKDPESRPTSRDLLLSLVGGANEAAVTTTLGESWTSEPTRVNTPSPAETRPNPEVAQGNAHPQSPPQPQHGRPGYAEWSTEPVGETATGPSYGPSSPVPPPPMPPPSPVPSPSPGFAPGGVQDGQRRATRRKGFLVAGAALATAALLAGGTYLVAQLGDDSGDPAQAQPPATPGGPPKEPMFVRIDTAAGWPQKCHADIGTYTPGQAAPVPILRGDTCDMLPERSPADRNKVAFTRRFADHGEAWVMNADGSGARMVTDRLAPGSRVTWSPDGTQLAFTGRDGRALQLFAITIGQREPRRLTDDPALKDDPMWSVTGKIVFWSRRDGAQQLYTLDPRNPEAPWTKLTRDEVTANDPEWSPDGTKIAYTRGDRPNGDIWVMNADGSGARRVTSGGGHEMDPAWSRDGKWICYVSGPVETPSVRTIRVDGTGDRPFGPTNGTIGHPTWS
ncbi:hypothetical protein Acsp03_26030 [Actinomadura sp. NBRC 104412]|uniref:protein kinase domain-containing protein n=1 Tax=Actinomadura sp. NBRC 104412 TaxID=3032203 RepID=UPI0024A19D75|nr:protein kinase [Actinomadura sp. NBRC 104412]GLZ05137.1 hypothetical protein Acsp03_26030 [Actinomadura sp. NBRC 104412]